MANIIIICCIEDEEARSEQKKKTDIIQFQIFTYNPIYSNRLLKKRRRKKETLLIHSFNLKFLVCPYCHDGHTAMLITTYCYF